MKEFKSLYGVLCVAEPTIPLQLQPWWLDTVCGPDKWQVALAFNKAREIVGALPYYIRKHRGFRVITNPPFSDYAGPWIKVPQSAKGIKRERIYSIEQQILKDLVEQLPRVYYFHHQYTPEMTNWLPFFWKNYKQTTRYTFRIPSNTSVQAIEEQFKHTVRTDIRKASKQVDICRNPNLKEFWKLTESTFERNQLKNPYKFSLLEKLDQQLADRKQRKIFLARDIKNQDGHAGLYIIWDQQTAFCLLSGMDSRYRGSGAIHLLFREAIFEMIQAGKTFDFGGSMLPGLEHLFRSFGGQRLPYFKIYYRDFLAFMRK